MASAFDSRFRRSTLVSAALVAALAWAGAASATPVARTADLTLTVQVGAFANITISATGATVTVDSAAGTLSIAAGQVVQTAPIIIPVTATTMFASLRATGIDNLAGVFSLGGGAVTSPANEWPCPGAALPGGCVTAGAGNLGGQMFLSGTIFPVIVPMLQTAVVPLYAMGIGHGGFARIPNTPAGFLFDAAPWTQGVGKVIFPGTSTTTWMGVFMGVTSTFTSSMTWFTTVSVTGAGGTVGTANSGTITLVTPTFVSAFGNVYPTLTSLQIHFIPEPGTAVLLAAGLVGLVAAGRRRSRH